MQFSWPIFFVVLSLGVVQLAVGVVFGRCLPIWQPKTATANRPDARRLREFANRMRRLVNSVAEDVDQHQSQIRQANENLVHAENFDGGDLTGFVLKSVAQIVQINERLQSRLSTTEDKLQQQSEQIESHMTAARTDSLTGLPNRRAFDDELRRRLAEWQRKSTTFCLIMIDIDHFKTFNDQYGHLAGDYVLRSVGDVFQKALRDMDLVCRIGGEEFAVLLPSTSAFDARRATERIRKMVASQEFQFEQSRLQLTISSGLTAVEHNDDTVSLMQRADEALYMAKDEGRNCGFFHNGVYCELINSDGRSGLHHRKPGDDVAETAEMAAICDDLRTRLADVTEKAADPKLEVDQRR